MLGGEWWVYPGDVSVSNVGSSSGTINTGWGVMGLVRSARDCIVVTTRLTTPRTRLWRWAVRLSESILMPAGGLVGVRTVAGGVIADGNDVVCDCAPDSVSGDASNASGYSGDAPSCGMEGQDGVGGSLATVVPAKSFDNVFATVRCFKI